MQQFARVLLRGIRNAPLAGSFLHDQFPRRRIRYHKNCVAARRNRFAADKQIRVRHQRRRFIRARAPYRPLHNGSSLYSGIVRRLQAAGVKWQGKHGPHAFRHARAVSLLRAAVPSKVIGDVLGHRASASTAVYLKLATDDLRKIALDVPGVE